MRPTTYHHLVRERGWEGAAIAAATVDALEREICGAVTDSRA